MRLNTQALAAAIAVSLCASISVQAKQAPAVTELTALTRGVAADVTPVDTAEGQFTEDGAAMALYGSSFRAPVGSAADMARAYLAADYAKLGLSEVDLADFSVAHVRAGDDFSVVRLRQWKQGLPVYGSDLAVSVTPAGKIIFVASAAVRKLGTVDVSKATRTSAQAVNAATSYLGVSLDDQESEQMVYLAGDGSSRVVWRVNGSPVGGSSFWQLLVDAETGEVLRAQDIANYADGTGTVWKPDPLSSNRQTYNNATGYGDSPNGGAPNSDSPQLTAALFPVTLRDITLTGANYTLVGPWADCRELSAPADGECPSQTSTSFNVTRSNLYFDAVNVYYHIDTYLRYVNTTLGVTAKPFAYTGGVRYDAHALNRVDNSNYVGGSSQRLAFGEGDVDDAQDADVVIHELGHGIHDWITNGGLSQTQGLSEGFGDYVAAGYSRDFPSQWTPADPQYYWTFNWDGHNVGTNFGWAGRLTNWQTNHTYQTMGSDIYSGGQYWASCNLVARDLIGGAAMDLVYFKGVSMTTSNSNQTVAAQAIATAATTLNYNNAQMTALSYAYTAGNTAGNAGCNYPVTVTIPPAVDLIYKNGFDSTP